MLILSACCFALAFKVFYGDKPDFHLLYEQVRGISAAGFRPGDAMVENMWGQCEDVLAREVPAHDDLEEPTEAHEAACARVVDTQVKVLTAVARLVAFEASQVQGRAEWSCMLRLPAGPVSPPCRWPIHCIAHPTIILSLPFPLLSVALNSLPTHLSSLDSTLSH